jgi:hypothetical protein
LQSFEGVENMAMNTAGVLDEVASKKQRKWIDAEIARLDPVKDCTRIWQLAACYRTSPAILNMAMAQGFMRLVGPGSGANTISRDGKGLVVRQQQRRYEETVLEVWTWNTHDPDSQETIASVERVNKYHDAYRAKYPDAILDAAQYTYTICIIACEPHRVFQRFGLPGFSKKVQEAAYHHWSGVAKHFRIGDVPGIDLPDSFQGMLDYMTMFERDHYTSSPQSRIVAESLMQQYTDRWYPKPLRGFGRTVVLSLATPELLRVHNLKQPSPFMRTLIRRGLGLLVTLGEKIAPDPTDMAPIKEHFSVHQDDRPLNRHVLEAIDQFNAAASA